MKSDQPIEPRARKEGLVVQRLPDETLVYDVERDLAHCLNQTAAMVWDRCDGTKTIAQIARAISDELNHAVDEKFVSLAVDRLGRNHLLIDTPASSLTSSVNRREVVKALTLSAAVAVPVVASIVAPTPAQAASGCKANGQICDVSIECCSGFCNDGRCGPPA